MLRLNCQVECCPCITNISFFILTNCASGAKLDAKLLQMTSLGAPEIAFNGIKGPLQNASNIACNGESQLPILAPKGRAGSEIASNGGAGPPRIASNAASDPPKLLPILLAMAEARLPNLQALLQMLQTIFHAFSAGCLLYHNLFWGLACNITTNLVELASITASKIPTHKWSCSFILGKQNTNRTSMQLDHLM